MSRKKKSTLEVVGTTTDGRPVFGGIFKLQDTHGLPLLLMWKQLADKGAVIAWDAYIADAQAHGWSDEKIASGIREVARFGLDRQEGEALMVGVNKLLEAQHEKISAGEAGVVAPAGNCVGAVQPQGHSDGDGDSEDGGILHEGHDSESLPQSGGHPVVD
jgi:hypothetical protein